MSPSLRGRGLKYGDYDEKLMAVESPSLRGRGLKFMHQSQFAGSGEGRPLCEGVD